MNSKNLLIILCTIFLFGLSVFFRKLSVDRIHPYQLQIIAGIVYAVELPLWMYLISKNPNIGNYNPLGVTFGIICIVFHVIAAVLFGILMKSSNSTGVISAMVAANPIVTAIFSYLILNEEFTTRKVIGMITTLVGISLFTL